MGIERNSKFSQRTLGEEQKGGDISLDSGAMEREGEEAEF